MKRAQIFQLDEDGLISDDFITVREGQIPPDQDFDEWVETRREERAIIHEAEYVSVMYHNDEQHSMDVTQPPEF